MRPEAVAELERRVRELEARGVASVDADALGEAIVSRLRPAIESLVTEVVGALFEAEPVEPPPAPAPAPEAEGVDGGN